MDFKSLRIAFALLLPLLWVDGVWAEACAFKNYDLRSTADADALGQTGCTTIVGNLQLFETRGVSLNIDALSNIIIVHGDLRIYLADTLTNLDGLANLTSVGGYLWIKDNDALTNLDGLASLTSVGGDLSIRDSFISNLNGLANLTSVGGALILNRTSLNNLNGLANLSSVGGSLSVGLNMFLNNCQGIAPLLGWPNGPPDDNVGGAITFEANRIGCNSIEEILEQVGAQPPAVPTVTSTDYEDGTIILTVSVSNNGGAKIRRYDAACSDGTDVFTGTSTSSQITVSYLTNGVAYTCTVTATNSVGTSSASAATAPITPEEQVGGLPIWLLYQATQ